MIRSGNECLIREKKHTEKHLTTHFMLDKIDDRFYFKKHSKRPALKIVISEDGIAQHMEPSDIMNRIVIRNVVSPDVT